MALALYPSLYPFTPRIEALRVPNSIAMLKNRPYGRQSWGIDSSKLALFVISAPQ